MTARDALDAAKDAEPGERLRQAIEGDRKLFRRAPTDGCVNFTPAERPLRSVHHRPAIFQSDRSAVDGSTREARMAGRNALRRVMAMPRTIAEPYTAGSPPWTPKSIAVMPRAAA